VPLQDKRLLVIGGNDELALAVASAAAGLGASVVRCQGGRAALDEADFPGAGAAIVDLPLPDMRADVFLIGLRDRGIPCVAVSGVLRGARFAATATRFGAVAFFEKPFDVSKALQVLAGAAVDGKRVAAEATRPPPGAPSGGIPVADFDSLVFSTARPALDDTLPGIPLTPRAAEGLELPLPGPDPAPATRGSVPALPDGDLSTTRVPRLLTALHVAQVTGALTLTRGPLRKLALFDQGRPVFAASNLPSERFAARCVREGILSAGKVSALVEEIGPKEPLNEALVERGLLDEATRARLVAEQVRDILWSTFPWRDGAYRMLVGSRARRPIVPVDLFPGDVILDGVRQTSTLESLRKDLPGALALAPGTDPSFELYDLAIDQAEAEMLAHADGTKTVDDLVLLSGLDERSALAFLQGCRDIGVLDEVSRVLSGTRRIGFM
jgi:CheY-like chemotaxis protein